MKLQSAILFEKKIAMINCFKSLRPYDYDGIITDLTKDHKNNLDQKESNVKYAL